MTDQQETIPCRVCGRELPESAYNPSALWLISANNGEHYLRKRPRCRECQKRQFDAWYANPENKRKQVDNVLRRRNEAK